MAMEFINDTSAATWLLPTAIDHAAAQATLWFGPTTFEAYARVLELPDPQFDGQSESQLDEEVLNQAPSDVELIGRTVGVLRSHSHSPADLFFLLWEGYPYRPALPATSRFDLAGFRQYALAVGAIDDWTEWVTSNREVHGRAFPPAFVWPADRQWCLAFDVDSHFAGVGASSEAIARLLETEEISTERATRGTPAKLYG